MPFIAGVTAGLRVSGLSGSRPASHCVHRDYPRPIAVKQERQSLLPAWFPRSQQRPSLQPAPCPGRSTYTAVSRTLGAASIRAPCSTAHLSWSAACGKTARAVSSMAAVSAECAFTPRDLRRAGDGHQRGCELLSQPVLLSQGVEQCEGMAEPQGRLASLRSSHCVCCSHKERFCTEQGPLWSDWARAAAASVAASHSHQGRQSQGSKAHWEGCRTKTLLVVATRSTHSPAQHVDSHSAAASHRNALHSLHPMAAQVSGTPRLRPCSFQALGQSFMEVEQAARPHSWCCQ